LVANMSPRSIREGQCPRTVGRKNLRWSNSMSSSTHSSTSPLRALQHRDFARMWLANVVSDIGTWMQLVTIGTLVASRTGSALQTGLVAVATFAPQAVAAPIGGTLADRYDRRKLLLMVLAGQTMAATALAFAVSANLGSAALTGIVLVQGIIGSASNPIAAAMLPDLVPRDALLAASSLQSVSWNSGRILGPILASVTVGLVGATWSIAANAASFAVLLLAVGLLRKPFLPAATDAEDGVLVRLRQGARALRKTRSALFAWQMGMGPQLFIAPMIGLAPIIATRSLGGDRGTASILLVCMGAGSIVGSLAVSSLVTIFGRARSAICLLAISCALTIAYAQTTSIGPAAVCIGLLGMSFIGGHVTISSVVPRDSPAGERGRIASIYSASLGLSYGLGVTWMGAVGDATNLHVAMTLGGVIAAVLLASSLALFPDRWRLLGGSDPMARRAVVRAGLEGGDA
jgi:MFS family permease